MATVRYCEKMAAGRRCETRTRILFAVGALLGALLLAVAASAGSEPVKQYTFPAGPQTLPPRGPRVPDLGKLTVFLPAAWKVAADAESGTTFARDPAHRYPGVSWAAGTIHYKLGTTLANISRWNATRTMNAWVPEWTMQLVGNSYLTLPVGKVLRLTVRVVPPKDKGGWAARYYQRSYYLDQGFVRMSSGWQRQFFSVFTVMCKHDLCAAHNGQLAAIMHSIRLSS
jgi:hypothetical protein